MSPRLLRDLGLDEHQLTHWDLADVVAANGQSMKYVGSFPALITLQDIEIEETVHVFREVTGMLLSWYASKNLGILPPDYPQPSALTRPAPSCPRVAPLASGSARDPAQEKQQLIEEFSDVFSEEGPLQAMIGDPMKIHLRDQVEPFAVRAARKIPFSWQSQVKDFNYVPNAMDDTKPCSFPVALFIPCPVS